MSGGPPVPELTELGIVPGEKNGRRYWWGYFRDRGGEVMHCPHLHETEAEARICIENVNNGLKRAGVGFSREQKP